MRITAFRLAAGFNLFIVLSLASPARAAATGKGIPCAPGYERSPLSLCATNASGQAMLEVVELDLPKSLPPVDVTPVRPSGSLLKHVYARVIHDEVMVYSHPADYFDGRPPARSLGTGFIFVSELGKATYRGEAFVQINPGEFVRESDLEEIKVSNFHGTAVAGTPAVPFGWVVAGFQVRQSPGAPPRPSDAWLPRYAMIQVYGAQTVGDWTWYMVGPDQWIEQRSVALISPTPPMVMPGRLIAVDIYEQTLVAYQDGTPVYATLISSGLAAWSTPPGLYRVYYRTEYGPMEGAYKRDWSDYYYLEDVPFTMYFDGDRAVHGAYWHDGFGTKRSHGCVNVSPIDSKWLFGWASVGTPVLIFNSAPSAATGN